MAHTPSSFLMAAPKRSDDEPDALTFQPPAGGDQLLQSNDGHEFRVDSILLTLSSSTFRKMFETEDLRDRTIKLEEDRETMSLVLESIYPGKPPVVDTLALIQKGLAAAQSYNLEGLTYILDQQLRVSMKENPAAFNPLAVWNTAKSFDLTETQKLAVGLVTVKRHDFRTPKALTRVAENYSQDLALIRLVGSQGARAKVLTDVLFAFHQRPMRFEIGNSRGGVGLLACHGCNVGISNFGSRFSPNWMIWWAHETHKFLMSNSLEAASSFFDPSIMYAHRAVCCQGCLNEFTGNGQLHVDFVLWASGVKELIQTRLAEIEALQLS